MSQVLLLTLLLGAKLLRFRHSNPGSHQIETTRHLGCTFLQ